jgi:DNA-binding transcriptional LysR family regulator
MNVQRTKVFASLPAGMQIETFKIFCDLVETGSFSRAAVLNSITQSAVSQQIRALEDRFKVTLIERGRRHFSLTPEGRAFLDAGKEILSIYNHLGDRIHELQNVIAGDIKIASIYSIGLHELPPYLKEFRRMHPDVEVHIEYRRSAQVYTEVLNGGVDMGLVSFPAVRRGLQIEPFLKDRLVLICHPDHPLASKKKVRVEELQGEKFIAFEPDAPTRKVIDRHLKEHGVTVNQTMEFDNVETVKRAVEIEHGISIVPEKTVQLEAENGSIRAVEIDKPEMWRPLGILLKRNRARSPAQKEFIGLLQKNLANRNGK